MPTYQRTTTVEAIQYVAPTGPDDGNVAEMQAFCPDAIEQADWDPATGKNALVLPSERYVVASIANTDWVVDMDGVFVVIDASAFDYEPVAETPEPAKPAATPTPAE